MAINFLTQRSLEPELMDSDLIIGPVLDRFHRDLARVNGLLGSFQTVERFLRKDKQPIQRVLDIGCGGGDLLVYLRRKMGVDVTGIDLKPGYRNEVPVIVADDTREALP